MPDSDPRGWHSRGYLPHYDDGAKIQSITYRLADALPRDVVAKLAEQALDDQQRRLAIECHLDAGYGACILRQPRNAEAVLAAWRHFDGTHYRLHAWVIMPNHVHVLLEPLAGHEVGKIISGWKSVSARQILTGSATAPGRNGKRHVWQLDYWDRFIRDERHYRATVGYIHANPVKAGLVARAEEWIWSSAPQL